VIPGGQVTFQAKETKIFIFIGLINIETNFNYRKKCRKQTIQTCRKLYCTFKKGFY